MKNVPGFFACVLVIAIVLVSCDRNETTIVPSLSSVQDPDKEQKIVFAKALARAVAAEPAVRRLLKQEAQKMIDEDYDVVYALVRDAQLSNGHTLRETLLPYFSTPAELSAIEEQLPLLTIFVPVLPNGTFSAKDWDADNQVPDVAIRLRGTNEIPIVTADGHQILLEPSLVPGYPVIVVKTSERMISEKQPGFRETESTRTIKGSNGVSYKFTDDLLDRSLMEIAYREEKQQRLIVPDVKLKAAYDIYKNADGWQRDYIYYGITPSSPDGEFSYDYKEYISSFFVTGDAYLVYQKMAEQRGDPLIKSGK